MSREKAEARLKVVLSNLGKMIATTDAIFAKINGPVKKIKVEIKGRLFPDPKTHALIAWLRSMKLQSANRSADMIANAISSCLPKLIIEVEREFGSVPTQWIEEATKAYIKAKTVPLAKNNVLIPNCPSCGDKWGVSVIGTMFECRNPTCARDGTSWKFSIDTTDRPESGRNSWPIMNKEPGRVLRKMVK